MNCQHQESGYIGTDEYKGIPRYEWTCEKYDTELYKKPIEKLIKDANSLNCLYSENKPNNKLIHSIELKKQHDEGYWCGKLIYVDDKNQVQIYDSKVYKGWVNLIY